MPPLLLALLRMAVTEPLLASALGAVLAGQPAFSSELVSICKRESRCRMVGGHHRDAWAGPTMFRKAMKVGWLDPSCVFHAGPKERFSTRGIHGLSAAYSLRFIDACLPPEVLDIPLVSAIVATRRAAFACREHGACNRQGRRRQWAGARKYDRRAAATKQP